MPEKTIISIGGNAIIKRNGAGTIAEQFENIQAACAGIARLALDGYRIIVTHGNGPIVGNIVLQNEAAKDILPPMPLYICDADSEGGLGFTIQQAVYNELRKVRSAAECAAVITQVAVDPDDPAFKNPSKPIGPFYAKEEAASLAASCGWVMADDSGRGWRRVVPSPRPVRVIEAGVVERLAASGVIVIAAGGGGVPVVEAADGTLRGIDAVIDKDYATSLLARQTGAGLFVNLTQVDMVYMDFGRPGQKGLPELNVENAKRYLAKGQFHPGSMGPKIESAIEFLESGGQEVIITSPELMGDALKGRAGTRIFK
ncbi:MAG: carbamate kinase [Deltaproteobacteria bacterium]|nr:carbamate kinase [Deltaproteobacteria bacterium]